MRCAIRVTPSLDSLAIPTDDVHTFDHLAISSLTIRYYTILSQDTTKRRLVAFWIILVIFLSAKREGPLWSPPTQCQISNPGHGTCLGCQGFRLPLGYAFKLLSLNMLCISFDALISHFGSIMSSMLLAGVALQLIEQWINNKMKSSEHMWSTMRTIQEIDKL